LNGGRWQGKQIVSERWIRESTTQQAPDREYGINGGWDGSVQVIEHCHIRRASRGRQFILVLPELQNGAASPAGMMAMAWESNLSTCCNDLSCPPPCHHKRLCAMNVRLTMRSSEPGLCAAVSFGPPRGPGR